MNALLKVVVLTSVFGAQVLLPGNPGLAPAQSPGGVSRAGSQPARHIPLRPSPGSELDGAEVSLTFDGAGGARVSVDMPLTPNTDMQLFWILDTRASTYHVVQLTDDPVADAARIASVHRKKGVDVSWEPQLARKLDEKAKRYRAEKARRAPEPVPASRAPAAAPPLEDAETSDDIVDEPTLRRVPATFASQSLSCSGNAFARTELWEPARLLFGVAHLAESWTAAWWTGNPLPNQFSSNASHGCWSNPSTFIGTNWSTEACIPQMTKYSGGFVSVTSGVFKNWDFQLNVHGVRAYVRAQIEHAGGGVRLSGSFYYQTLGPWNPGYEGWLLSMNTDASWATESCIVLQPPSAEQQCLDAGGYWDGNLCFYSPILIDVGTTGFDLTDPAGGVTFDADGNGVRERLSWTEAGADDAWLALDRNGNRLIDNGTELFGNFTVLADGRTRAANGFEALKALDGGPAGSSTMDGLIDANDSVFARLLLWTDRNHNGMSEPDELLPLAQSGIVALHTDYKESRRRDEHGNLYRQRAKVIWTTADSFAYDIWLRRQ